MRSLFGLVTICGSRTSVLDTPPAEAVPVHKRRTWRCGRGTNSTKWRPSLLSIPEEDDSELTVGEEAKNNGGAAPVVAAAPARGWRKIFKMKVSSSSKTQRIDYSELHYEYDPR